jgi:2-polyprenyl-6-hydroxyphenyl methylase / 3-demethylubiquinone-9 3-methyltransferase
VTANRMDIYEEADWWDPEHALHRLNEMNPARFEYFGRFLEGWEGLRVLDVGCGGGFASEHLARAGAKVTGLDQSNGALDRARHHAGQVGLTIDYVQGDAQELPFDSGAFDALVCVDTLEHLPDPRKGLAEMHRVLVPEGRFFFDTINRTIRSKVIMIWMLEDLFKRIPKGTHDWRMFIKPDELRSMLSETGFERPALQGFILRSDRTTGGMVGELDPRDLSVMYIGTATSAPR